MYVGFCGCIVGLVDWFFWVVYWWDVDDVVLVVFDYVVVDWFCYVEYGVEVGVDYGILVDFVEFV